MTRRYRLPRSDVTTGPPAPAARTLAAAGATGAAVGTALIVALVVADHDIDPSWRFISEYQLGTWGGFMSLAFLALAFSCVMLFLAVRSQVATRGGRVGLVVLLVSGAGFLLAGTFRTDPLDATVGTLSGFVHSIAAVLGGLVPLAAYLIAWSLARNVAWRSYRRGLGRVTVVAVLANLASITQQLVMGAGGGGFGPDVPLGWPNRVFVTLLGVWLLLAALLVRRASRDLAAAPDPIDGFVRPGETPAPIG